MREYLILACFPVGGALLGFLGYAVFQEVFLIAAGIIAGIAVAIEFWLEKFFS